MTIASIAPDFATLIRATLATIRIIAMQRKFNSQADAIQFLFDRMSEQDDRLWDIYCDLHATNQILHITTTFLTTLGVSRETWTDVVTNAANALTEPTDISINPPPSETAVQQLEMITRKIAEKMKTYVDNDPPPRPTFTIIPGGKSD